MQKFKENDLTEQKYIDAKAEAFTTQADGLDEMEAGAYTCFQLGDALYETERAPLTKAIDQEIFRQVFPEIFDAFVRGGSFEAYLTVFRKIFGEDVDVEFTVPAAGKLNIDIEATNISLYDFVARRIEGAEWVRDNVITTDGGPDQIMFQMFKGFQSQYELEQMLFEMVPAGIFTTITLSQGS